jgi:hypothetical protein
MKKGESRPLPKLPQKGLRGQTARFAEYHGLEAAFDAKTHVTWEDVEAFRAWEREYDPKINELLVDALMGIEDYKRFSNVKNAEHYVIPDARREEARAAFFIEHQHREKYLLPLLKAATILGPAIFQHGGIYPHIMLWWRERRRNPEARDIWRQICQALMAVGRGKDASGEVPQPSRVRKRKYVERDKEATQQLQDEIDAAYERVPGKVRNPRAVREQISTRVLELAVQSPDPARRRVAARMQKARKLST